MARCTRKTGGAGEARTGRQPESVVRVEDGMPVVAGGGCEACWGSVIATLGLIVRRAFEEFERSKQPLETRTTTTRTRQTPRGVEVTETVTVRRVERVGDVRILKTLLQCVDREMRLLKELHGDPKEFLKDLGELSEAELEALNSFSGFEDSDDAEDPQRSNPGDNPGEAVEEPAGSAAGEEASGAAAVSKADPEPRDSEDPQTSEATPAEIAPFPSAMDFLALDQPERDELMERLEGWLRDTEAFLPAESARDPVAA